MRRLLPLLALVVACSPAARLKAHAQRDTRALGEAASEYWSAVRWGDAPTASTFLETADQKVRLALLMSEPRVRVTDASIVQVVVGEELPEARLPETREGVAVVRVEAYDVVTGRAEARTLEQHWVRADREWRIDAERSPVGADRPW